MSLSTELSTRIGKALKGLKVTDGSTAEKVISTVDNIQQVLREEIVPLSKELRSLVGQNAGSWREDVMSQMDHVIDTNIGLKTYPELASEMDGDAPLALLVWRGSLTSTFGHEVLPAKLQLAALGAISQFYGFEVINGKTVDLVEITGEGKLIPVQGSAKPRNSMIYSSSPVIKLIK